MSQNNQQNNQEEREVKEKLFGGVRKRKQTGGYIITQDILREPLPEGTVTRIACKGCGMVLAILKKGAEAGAKCLGKPVPEDWSEWFFETETCLFCDTRHKGLALRQIKDFPETFEAYLAQKEKENEKK